MARCKECAKETTRRWNRNNMDRVRAYNRASGRKRHLKYTYGISLEIYDEMLRLQRGLCRICGNGPDSKHGVLYVDHSHKTGAVRGLLCEKCNHGLGRFLDNPDLLRRAAEYLEDF